MQTVKFKSTIFKGSHEVTDFRSEQEIGLWNCVVEVLKGWSFSRVDVVELGRIRPDFVKHDKPSIEQIQI